MNNVRVITARAKGEKTMIRIVSFVLALTIAFTLTGCNGNPFKQSGSPPLIEEEPGYSESEAPPGSGSENVPLASYQRFPDVPLPHDAEEDLERTFVYENDDLQIGRMVYTSKSSCNELAQFYIEECPTADWELVSVTQADGYELLFKKPGKQLQVSINKLGIGRGRRLILKLTPAVGSGKGS